MRVVLDTNVVISRYLSQRGSPARIFEYLDEQAFQLVTSTELLQEYRRAFGYSHLVRRHGLSQAAIDDIIDGIARTSLLVVPEATLEILTVDPSDNMVLTCAMAGSVDYIVTGDKQLLELGMYEGIVIISPAVFVQVFVSSINAS